MEYSVIIPIHNETTLLFPLVEDLRHVFSSLGISDNQYELIFVDRGSNQRTRESLNEVIAQFPSISAICLHREVSLSIALSTGFLATLGSNILTVTGHLKSDIRGITLKLFESMKNQLDGVIVEQKGGLHLGLYRRHVLTQLKTFAQYFEYLPLMAHHKGFKLHDLNGENVFHWPHWRVALDCLTLIVVQRFASSPRKLFVPLGVGLMLLSVFGTSLALFGFGLNIIFLGWAAELILHQTTSNNLDALLRSEIECVLGNEYAKRKIAYGLASKMQQAS
ncbi:MAG: glycosyltransferase [Gammaproteobacteria bacterium]